MHDRNVQSSADWEYMWKWKCVPRRMSCMKSVRTIRTKHPHISCLGLPCCLLNFCSGQMENKTCRKIRKKLNLTIGNAKHAPVFFSPLNSVFFPVANGSWIVCANFFGRVRWQNNHQHQFEPHAILHMCTVLHIIYYYMWLYMWYCAVYQSQAHQSHSKISQRLMAKTFQLPSLWGTFAWRAYLADKASRFQCVHAYVKITAACVVHTIRTCEWHIGRWCA